MQKYNPDFVADIYKMLLKIRSVEEEIVRTYPSDNIKSPVHLSIGQEAVAVGVSFALKKEDIVFATYRGHAAYLAKGGNLQKMMAELYGKQEGCSQGKGGSMHLIDIENGIMGTSAIVASHIPVSVGYAWAYKQQAKDAIVVCYFGDGATEEGSFHESINFAALKKLPVLFICENNSYAIYSHIANRMSNPDITEKVASYGIPTLRIKDGDIFKIYEQASTIRKQIVENKAGPYFLEVDTCRWFDHVGIDDDSHLNYRNLEELNRYKEKDVLTGLGKMIDPVLRARIDQEVAEEIAVAIRFAEESNFPNSDELLRYVYQ